MVTNHVYAVAGAKGGVGKTTTSLNLGASLADEGYSAVTIELDLAMANVVDFLDIDIDPEDSTTLHDVLAGNAAIKAATYENGDGVAVVPSGTDLADYAETDLSRLPDAVAELRWHYDIVILDTPAGLSEETIRPLQLADEALLVSTPRVASIRNVQNTMALADRVETDVRGLILTKSGTGASPGAGKIAEFLDVELLGHVPEDDAVPHSQDSGVPVVSNAPNSGAAIAYQKIAKKLVDVDASTAEPENETVELKTPTDSPADIETNDADAATIAEGVTDGGTAVSPTRVTKPHSPEPPDRNDDSARIAKAPSTTDKHPDAQYRSASADSSTTAEQTESDPSPPADDSPEQERKTTAEHVEKPRDPEQHEQEPADARETTAKTPGEHAENSSSTHNGSAESTNQARSGGEKAKSAHQTTASDQTDREQDDRSVTSRIRSVIGF